jgi:hypothetical protein
MTPKEWLEEVRTHQEKFRYLVHLHCNRDIEEYERALIEGNHKELYAILQMTWIKVPIDIKLRRLLPGWQELDALCVKNFK